MLSPIPEVAPEAPLPEDPRSRFNEIFRRHEELCTWPSWSVLMQEQTEMEEAVIEAADVPRKDLPPRVVWNGEGRPDTEGVKTRWDAIRAWIWKRKRSVQPVVDALIKRHQERAEDSRKSRLAQAQTLEIDLRELASTLVPRQGSDWRLVFEAQAQQHTLHGAWAQAEIEALPYLRCGLEVEVREEAVRHHNGGGWSTFLTFVRADPEDLALVQFGHALELDERLREIDLRKSKPQELGAQVPIQRIPCGTPGWDDNPPGTPWPTTPAG